MQDFFLCFIPLFVAVDAIGLLPLFLGITEGFSRQQIIQTVVQSIITAALVAFAFVLIGEPLLEWLGLIVPDFMVAGGVLLFVIALSDLLDKDGNYKRNAKIAIGAVPIGVPLLTGPAVLTTSLLMVKQYGTLLTLSSIAINIILAGIIFIFAIPVRRLLGVAGTRTLSKISALLLASIAVMIIRKGLVDLIKTLK
jgi:multiple antibiotic resistance protein